MSETTTLAPLPGGRQPGDYCLAFRPGATVPYAAPLERADGVTVVAVGDVWSAPGAAPGGAPTVTAGATPVNGHFVLMPDGAGRVVNADPFSNAYAFAGIAVASAAAGAAVQMVESGGIVTEPTWAWTPGMPVFCGAGGALTASPPIAGTLQQVGVALTATSIVVLPGLPVIRM